MDSLIPWIGGKKLLRDKIIERFPPKFDRYIEVFGGAAWVLFRKDKHAAMEVYNDVDGNIVNLFRCVKYHPDEIQKELDFVLNAREEFIDMKSQAGLTDIQRAARFFVVVKCSYGADRDSFSCAPKSLASARERIADIHARLARVVIEHKDFEALIKTYDRPETLFYCDPPYFKTEKYYSAEFTADDHARLKSVLSHIKGKFILSYNDDPFIRSMYAEYKIEELQRSNSLRTRYDGGSFRELVITNF